MVFTCKYKGGYAVFLLIFGGFWGLHSLSMALFFLNFGRMMERFGEDSIFSWAVVGLLFSALIGLGVLLLGVKRLRTPLLVADGQGVRIGKFFRSYYFTWSELESITHYTKNDIFGRRRPFFYREQYDFINIFPKGGEELTLEISYSNISAQEILVELQQYFPNIYIED